jgi:transposase
MRAALPSCLRLGWYRPLHAKSASAQEVRSLLTARKLIQAKLLDLESGIRGVLRGFGLKVGTVSRGRFEARILELSLVMPCSRRWSARCSWPGQRYKLSSRVSTVRC